MTHSSVHHELILPNLVAPGAPRAAERFSIGIASGHASWLELHRTRDGTVRYYLGAPTAWELDLTFAGLRHGIPGVQLGAEAACPIQSYQQSWGYLFRGVQGEPCHYWPMRAAPEADRAGLLLQSLSVRGLQGHEIVLQVLFRRVPYWERGFLSPTHSNFALEKDVRLQNRLAERNSEPAYHVEIRAGLVGPWAQRAHEVLLPWFSSWVSFRGVQWWTLGAVKPSQRARFYDAFTGHNLARFSGRKIRRNIAGSELSLVLPIPWRDHHPEVAYSGAPCGRVPPDLIAQPEGRPDVVVGRVGGDRVRLPPLWNHMAILGRTRSGKSTLALNIVLQILAIQPNAKVVVLEPTGNLINDLVGRLPKGIARDTIEIDPSHPTFQENGAEMVAVPLNLLHLPNRQNLGGSEFERRAERLSGGLLQSIKNAWGEESIGGRADFILRTVLQGLLAVEGTNLVDAYEVLSNKEAIRRLERLARGNLLRSALRVHLPKLDYTFTISSLDKVGKIATNPVLRKSLCQRYGSVGFDELLNHRLLLLNLGKGALGTEGTNFLGAIFLTQLWSALQGRQRKDVPVYLIVDEFHNYAIPAFADMLSEGARLGLHVVAITQYLDRIPEKVRGAIVGNVDAWALFSMGAEDMLHAWRIVGGAQFRWLPEHFSGGLGPFQAALSTPGSLLKVTTSPATTASQTGEPVHHLVDASSRRYARREDSEASPLRVSSEQVASLLRSLSPPEPRGREELAVALGWSYGEIDAVVARCRASGDVVGAGAGEVGLTRRGLFHRQSIEVARNEGEDHTELLADAAAFLAGKGIDIRIVSQGGGYFVPDAEFECEGRTYSLEVECSTVTKRTDQVIRNVRKALAGGRRCLMVVSGRELAEKAAGIVRVAVPHARLWREFGVAWPEGRGELAPLSDGGHAPWTFLRPTGGEEIDIHEEEPEEPGEPLQMGGPPYSNEGDVALTLGVARTLLASGKSVATAKDFLDRMPPSDAIQLDAQRLGMALSSVGVASRRVRRDRAQIREYDLRSLHRLTIESVAPANATAHTRRESGDKSETADSE